jgi:ATP-binding cassette, subfamily B, bacterial
MSAISKTAEFTVENQYTSNRSGPVAWIVSHAVRHWPFFLIAMAGAGINAYLATLAPIYIGQAFNAVLSTPPLIDILTRLTALLIVTQVGRAVIMLARNFSFEVIAQRMEKNIREELYVSLLGKSMTFHNLQSVGDTMARATNDVREINYLFSPGISLVVGSISFLVMPIIVAPSYHPSLVITPVVFTVFYAIALWHYLRTLSPVTDEVRSSFGALNSRLAESLDGIETVKAAAQECSEIHRFGTNVKRYRDAMVKQGDIEATFLPYLLLSLALGGGLLHALILSNQGVLDVGQVVGYFGVLMLLDFPTFISLFAYSRISVGISSARRILELIKREDNLDQNVSGYADEMSGDVTFRDVSFGYPDHGQILSDINIQVARGQTVALVGQTGSGKTTLVKLINRIFDVDEGCVLVDGVDVRDWNMAALRKNISIIEQDIFLFSQTIEENIAFGKPSASKEEIVTAAKEAQAHDFIMTLKEGYQTILGDRGVTLSGGQRQRLALARAFLTDPRILVLDDSTSSIDSETEDRIQRAIFRAAEGRTTIIITHRLSQIRWADLVVVLKNGRIAARGKHEELMETSEDYRGIFKGLT